MRSIYKGNTGRKTVLRDAIGETENENSNEEERRAVLPDARGDCYVRFCAYKQAMSTGFAMR